MKKTLQKLLLMALALIFVPSLCPAGLFAQAADDAEVAALRAKMEELYGNPNDASPAARINKMQAFIMEIALHAKSRNPDFNIIPQDGIPLAYVNGTGSTVNDLLLDLMEVIDGWGIEGTMGTSNTAGAQVPNPPSANQQRYINLRTIGKMITDTTSVTTATGLTNYIARSTAWNWLGYPRFGYPFSNALDPTVFAGNSEYNRIWSMDKTGFAFSINSNDINSLADAKNYLYYINPAAYDPWSDWDADVASGNNYRNDVYDNEHQGFLVPSQGGPLQPYGTNPLPDYTGGWDWWWRAKGLLETEHRAQYIKDLQAQPYDVLYIDAHIGASPSEGVEVVGLSGESPLTRDEVESLKHKPGGGKRQVIAYLSVGSAETYRWYVDPAWLGVDPSTGDSGFSTGSSSGIYTPPGPDGPQWLAHGYGGRYGDECVVEWWHPEWRDIIINGWHNQKSSIDRIVDAGFDGVYLDNVGVYSRSRWTAWAAYYAALGGVPWASAVNFDSNGGSAVVAAHVADGKLVFKPTDPTRHGYIFEGWYKEAELISAWNFEADVVTGDITLFAKWTPMVIAASPSAAVTKDKGNTNTLTITVTEALFDGTSNKIVKTFTIHNNADGTYQVGSYRVYVATSGNTKIDKCYIVG
ncbi:MAG: InlB B-repeat-containing protein [Terriglobales bacterium]